VIEPVERLVTFFRNQIPDLALPIRGPSDQFVVFGRSRRELYSVTQVVDGRSTAPGGRIERETGERVTTRSWTTVARIIDKLQAADASR